MPQLATQIRRGMDAGTAMTIKSVADEFGVTYGQAQHVLRRLWLAGDVSRFRKGRLLMYEGKQMRLPLKCSPPRLTRRHNAVI